LEPGERRFVSTVSAWEIAIKVQSGKLSLAMSLPDWIGLQISELGLAVLAVQLSHCQAYAALPFSREHRDPFDRMLVAQALTERLVIVSSDSRLRAYGVEVIW
jgi:PIN domain nuclease of toxin-antitoxin system